MPIQKKVKRVKIMSNLEYGYWEVTIEKSSGRLKIPTALLKSLPEDERKTFFITHGIGNHIMLWSDQAFKKRMNKLNTLDREERDVKKYRNAFLRNFTSVECDTQDRIIIPKPLLEKYGIEKDIVLLLDHGQIEIWSKKDYEKFDLDPEEMAELNEQLFAGKFNNVVTEKSNE